MAIQNISTPRGSVMRTTGGTVRIEWNRNFSNRYELKFSKAQKIVDSEVLRVCEPYTPLITSTLIKSSILGTVVGSGEVAWIAPYAHKVYNNDLPIGRETGPLRGSKWFDRAMVDNKKAIIRKAGVAFGGRVK